MSTEYAKALGSRLRAIRTQQGLSLHGVEQKSQGRWKAVVVGSYERGDRAVTVQRLAELAHFYGVPVHELLPGRAFWMMVVAILGTTISPYLFFWQAAQEVEDTKARPERRPLRVAPGQGRGALARIQLDTLVGMGFSNVVALAIMVTASATLHAAGHHELKSAADAAEALRPIAGNFAFALFALGIVGTGLLSVPVLAGSAAYALGESRRWPVGLARKPLHAKAFYGAIVVATFLGAAANIVSLSPVTALVWAAVLNAIVAVPVMALLMMMAVDRRVMGTFRISGLWRVLGWLATCADGRRCAGIHHQRADSIVELRQSNHFRPRFRYAACFVPGSRRATEESGRRLTRTSEVSPGRWRD